MSDATDQPDRGEPALRERPGATPELYLFELWSTDGAQSVAMRVELWTDPVPRRAWYAAHLFRPDAPLVTITEQAPMRNGLELRASGLWADHNIEAPFEHWSLGLEAFALEVDHPTDERGLRIPFGYELDWEMAPTVRRATAGGYEQPARVQGEVLLGAARHEIDTDGWRSHRRVGSLPSDARHHGRLVQPGGETGDTAGDMPGDFGGRGQGLIWSGPGEEPNAQRWGWARTDLPFGTLASGPWVGAARSNAIGFAERWSPAPEKRIR